MQKLNNGNILFIFIKKLLQKGQTFQSYDKAAIVRVKLLKPKARSFDNNFLIKINKMLSLFNFCIKVFSRIDTFKGIFMFK